MLQKARYIIYSYSEILSKRTEKKMNLINLLSLYAIIIQMSTLLKLNQQQESLTHYENALQILRWKAQQPFEKCHLERENKINELETDIIAMKLAHK